MNRSLLLSISILIVIFLSACADNPENNMILSITNNADFDFYSIEISTDKTTGGISNADGSKIKEGDTTHSEKNTLIRKTLT